MAADILALAAVERPAHRGRAGGDPPGRPQRDRRGREIAIRY